mgnify:CR=1 FL=1
MRRATISCLRMIRRDAKRETGHQGGRTSGYRKSILWVSLMWHVMRNPFVYGIFHALSGYCCIIGVWVFFCLILIFMKLVFYFWNISLIFKKALMYSGNPFLLKAIFNASLITASVGYSRNFEMDQPKGKGFMACTFHFSFVANISEASLSIMKTFR